MKFAIVLLVTLASSPVWALDTQTCMKMGEPAYGQEQSSGHIDGAPFIRAAMADGMTVGDIRFCLQKANIEYAKLKVHNNTSIDPEVLRRTTRDLYTALNSVPSRPIGQIPSAQCACSAAR
jgi:hypothetical protein